MLTQCHYFHQGKKKYVTDDGFISPPMRVSKELLLEQVW